MIILCLILIVCSEVLMQNGLQAKVIQTAELNYEEYKDIVHDKRGPQEYQTGQTEADICTAGLCAHGTCEIVGLNYNCKCDEGYSGVHCDKVIKTKPTPETNYKCDFERGLCPFLRNAVTNTENWRIFQGKNVSTEIGPSVDHTLGTANGSYLVVNMPSKKPVELQTVDLIGNYCIRFFYYMYGADTQYLNVTTHPIANFSHVQEHFSQRKTQGDRWNEARFTILETDTMKLRGFRLIFTASRMSTVKLGFAVALDDIELMTGKCPDTKGNAMEICTFEKHDCGYIAVDKHLEKWQHKSPSMSNPFVSKIPKKDHTLGTRHGGFWFSLIDVKGSNIQTSLLRSPVYKVPKTSINCLQFFYYIDAEGSSFFWGDRTKEAYLQASINHPYSNTTNPTWLTTKAKNTTIPKQWRYAEVKVNITQDYQFQFSAFFESSYEAVVAVDDVKLMPGRCPETGFCDFEEDICTWKSGEGQYKWNRMSTSSKPYQELRPAFDNTLGARDGYYIVLNSSEKSEGSGAVFESEILPPDEEELCLTFYYQMSGRDLGILKVIRREKNAINSTLWLMQGDQEKMWKKARAIIQPSVEEYQIVFQGTIGNGTKGFMAIDDIRIKKGELCEVTPPEAEPFEDDFDTTYELFNHTYDFKTSSMSSRYTKDFKTSNEPTDPTNDYKTSSEPTDYTNEYKTSSEPTNHTNDFKTSSELTDYTNDFKISSDPSDHTSNFKTSSETTYYTNDFKTSSEPSLSTKDFKILSESSDYTYDFYTSSEPINFTHDFKTSSEPIDFKTSSEPFDFKTSSEPSDYTSYLKTSSRTTDYTNDFKTSSESSDYTPNFNTSSESSVYTHDFKTSSEPSGYTHNFKTSSEPADYTHDFKTSSEPSDFIDDFNTTHTYEPIKSTYGRNISIPKPTTTQKPDICDPWKCDHGTCHVMGKNYRCECDEGYTGSKCDQEIKQNQNIILLWLVPIATINISIFVLLLIGIVCVFCRIKRWMEK